MGSHPTPSEGKAGRQNFGRRMMVRAALVHLAEGVGFEPTVSCPTSVFKTDAIDHSATPPEVRMTAGFLAASRPVQGKSRK